MDPVHALSNCDQQFGYQGVPALRISDTLKPGALKTQSYFFVCLFFGVCVCVGGGGGWSGSGVCMCVLLICLFVCLFVFI